MNVSGIGRMTNSYYQKLSSGKRINKAADDAAGLSIVEKLRAQRNGLDVGSRNAATSNDMIKVADGALSGISDSLQRMRELSIQASNSAVYGDDELGAIQSEIDQLKSSIAETAGTQFNGMNILDGSMPTSNVASDPNGGGSQIQMGDATLSALGIANYDVTGSFDIKDIDKAIQMVSGSRSSMGAMSNRLDYTVNYNRNTSLNTTSSLSRIQDLDYGKAVTEQKKNEVIDQYKLQMQRRKMENENGRVRQMFQY
jgi:flagellin